MSFLGGKMELSFIPFNVTVKRKCEGHDCPLRINTMGETEGLIKYRSLFNVAL